MVFFLSSFLFEACATQDVEWGPYADKEGAQKKKDKDE